MKTKLTIVKISTAEESGNKIVKFQADGFKDDIGEDSGKFFYKWYKSLNEGVKEGLVVELDMSKYRQDTQERTWTDKESGEEITRKLTYLIPA